MKSSIMALILLLLVVFQGDTSFAEDNGSHNAYDILAPCLGTVRPLEGSSLRASFDIISRKVVNPKMSDEEWEALLKWSETQNTCFRRFEEALAINSFEFPIIDVRAPEDLPAIFDYISLAGLSLIKTKNCINEGRYLDAANHVLKVIRFGRLIRNAEQGTLLSYIIGELIEQNGLSWLQEIVTLADFDRDALYSVLKQLPEYRYPDHAFAKSVNSEFKNFIIPYIKVTEDLIASILSQLQIKLHSMYDVNEFIALSIILKNHIVKNAMLPWPMRSKQLPIEIASLPAYEIPEFCGDIFCRSLDDDIEEFDINDEMQVAKWRRLETLAKGRKNLLGRWSFDEGASFDRCYQKSVALRTKSNMVKTFIALKAYQKTYGKYPETLSQLVEAEILKKLPFDLFANKPFHYSASKSLLWSVGPDEVDDLGDEEDDIVLLIE